MQRTQRVSSKMFLHCNLYSLISVPVDFVYPNSTNCSGSYSKLCLRSGLTFFVGSSLKPVLLVVFFLRYSDFPSFMKADIFKFKNTTDNPSATVASLSAAYFWLKVSRVIFYKYAIFH